MHADVSTLRGLCRDSLQLADAIERAGGPVPHEARKFDRARAIVEHAQQELDAGDLGIVWMPWVIGGLLAAVGVIGAATVPAAIREARESMGAVGIAARNTIATTEKLIRWAGYGALALGGYWATRRVMKVA
jgi:hypothetical protein